MVINIPITDDMKKEARRHADATMVNIKKTPNYTDLSVADRFYYGYLGELIVVAYLLDKNIAHEYHTSESGESQDSELFINGKRIDVKTASQPFHRRIMMPAKQKELHKSDYYIGVRLSDGTGEIFGYCTPEELGGPDDFGYGVPTMYKMLDELHDITELLQTAGFKSQDRL